MPTTKKRKIWLLSILAALGLLVLGWQFLKYHLAHKKIAQAVSEKTKGLYSLHYEDLSFDEVAGMLHVKNIEITPDTAVYRQMTREKNAPPILLNISIPSLDIARVKTPKALLNKELEGGRLEVTDASIRIMVHSFKKDSTVYNPAPDLAKQLLGQLLKISVDSVKITDANILVTGSDSSDVYFRGNNVSLFLSHLLIDSSAQKDSSSILFSRSLTLDCRKLSLPTKNKKYTLDMEGLRFTSDDNSLHMAQVKITPRLPEMEFVNSFPHQKDRYDFTLRDISLRHIDRKEIWRKSLRADSLLVRNSTFKVFRDLSRPPDTTSKVGKFPQQQLMHVPFPISINTIVFNHSFIEYKERNGKSDSAGRLQFYEAEAIIRNVTNRKQDIAKNNKCVVDFRARLLNLAPVNAHLVLLLHDPRGRFTIEGNIGSIDALALNPMTAPMGLARLDKGKINNLHFTINGTDSTGDGRVTLLYEDLKVTMLKRNDDKDRLDKKGLASLFANLLIKNSNKPPNPRIEEVHFKRIVNKSFFNLIWKTLFTGIKQSVGMK